MDSIRTRGKYGARLLTWRKAAFAAGLLAASSFGAPAHAASVQFAGPIDGIQETPPTFTGALASGTYIMDTVANTLSVNVVILVPPPSGEIAAHIHGFAPPGVPAGILFALPVGSPKVVVWNYSEAQEASIIAGLAYVNIHSAAFPGGEIRGQILRVPSCGDGILDGGESCDDGNVVAGDCCDASCNFEASGGACDGGTLCSAAGVCDGAGTCVAAPRGTCRIAGKSILLLKDDAGDDGKDKLLFKWIKGQQTDQVDFGVPTGTTDYALCIFAGLTPALIAEPQIAADAVKWGPIGTKGYKYKDPSGASSGVQKVILKGGGAGKAKALVKGKGSGLPDPTLGLATPVVAELVNSANNICFGATFGSEDVIKNDTAQFKAKDQ